MFIIFKLIFYRNLRYMSQNVRDLFILYSMFFPDRSEERRVGGGWWGAEWSGVCRLSGL